MAEREKKWVDRTPMREIVFGGGVVLILLSPVVGAIPGPGGTIVFAIGLAMVLRTSRWAKHVYARWKRRYPNVGRWTDWGLRRRSAARREQLAKQQKEQAQPEKASQGD